MGVLEQVTQLKKQGMPENEIIQSLQQQGISPKAINDALGQAQVKDAVSSEESEYSGNQQNNLQGMQPSIMEQDEAPSPNSEYENYSPQDSYQPQTQEISQDNQPYSYQPYSNQSQQQIQTQGYAYEPQQTPMQNYYTPEQNYSNNYSAGLDTDMIIEIAEQVFNEKIKILEQQIQQTNEFKTITYAKLENLAMRLKRIETIIDKLEVSILGKISDYGRGIDSIKKEMSMMQDSFSKALPSLAKHHTSSTHKKTSHKKK